jgi:sterol desaturase/sphingolipid hydroxylase (fatty acid hydroxylase superfamily)
MVEPTELTGVGMLIANIALLTLPVYLIAELVVLHFWRRKLRLRETRMASLGVVANILTQVIVGRLWGPLSVGVFAVLASRIAPIDSLGLGPVGWVYAWLVYEFFYWVQHWAAHKVRLLWCIHSPHHAAGSISMIVGANHHLLEGTFYMPFFAGFLTVLCGADPLACVAINVIDSVWGSFLHISDEMVRRGRYGWLERFMQTPSHHRAHHAKNVRYLDTNYNSITLFWDWAFGTLQPLCDDEPVDYGITREVDTGSFWDVHFGEFVLLARDVRNAETLRDKLGYMLAPPGWKPGDDSQTTASRKRAQLLETEVA